MAGARPARAAPIAAPERLTTARSRFPEFARVGAARHRLLRSVVLVDACTLAEDSGDGRDRETGERSRGRRRHGSCPHRLAQHPQEGPGEALQRIGRRIGGVGLESGRVPQGGSG